MKNILRISQVLIELSKNANFEATLTAKSKSDTSFLGPHKNTKDGIPKQSKSLSKYYSVENPVQSLTPGGINAY